MSKFINILLLIGLTTFTIFAEDKHTLNIPESLQDKIPLGYKVIEQITGDLNQDNQDDLVLILKSTFESYKIINRYAKQVDRNRRGVLIALKNKDTYHVVTLNPSCFSSENEDGGVYFPPELSIYIKKGNLYFHYGHGRYGYWTYTFRYVGDDFRLIGYDSIEGGVVIREILSVNFLSNKILTKKNINSNADGGEEVFQETWQSLAKPITIMLSKIKDMDEVNIERQINEQHHT